MNEVWKDIPGYEGLYQVSNLGNIKSLNAYNHNIEMMLNCPVHHSGYRIVILKVNNVKKTFNVHKLVAETFISNKTNFKYYDEKDKLKYIENLDKLQVNHKDENKTNNNVSNLEWCTPKYNSNYGTRINRIIQNESKQVNQYDLQGNFIKTWNSISDIYRELGINSSNIIMCCKGKYSYSHGYIWKYVN